MCLFNRFSVSFNISLLVTTQSEVGGIILKPLPGTKNFWLLHTNIVYIYKTFNWSAQ